METMLIFTDAATSAPMNIAVGVFLCITQSKMQQLIDENITSLQSYVANNVVYKEYNSRKSTWSEISTVIDALRFLEHQSPMSRNIELYTDCQSLCDLLGRRKEKLQKNNFITSSGKIHAHAALYQTLYLLTEKYQLHTIKIKGHNPQSQRITLPEIIFSIIDTLSRQKLREICL